MKKLMIAAAAALAMGSVSLANASGTISFDRDGAAAGVGAIAVDNFDWAPGNALSLGVFSTAPIIIPHPVTGVPTPAISFQLVAQGKLAGFVKNGPLVVTAPVGGTEFTYEVSFWEIAFGVGTGATALFHDSSKPSSFKMFYDTTPDANDILGTGFGDGINILSGTLVSSSGGFQDTTTTLGDPIVTLDQLVPDNQNGVRTRQGNGSTTVRIDASFADPDFFKSSITSLLIDLQDTTNNAVPFNQTNPSDQIMGFTPFYSRVAGGTPINGENAGGACLLGGQNENGGLSDRCDLHLQTDATTSFNPVVPEPSSLALIGLALGGLGFMRRRRAAA